MTKLVNSLAALCLVWAFGPSNAGAESLGPTLQKIKDAGTITIGNRDSSVPFSYLGADQKPIGFSLELCDLVVAKVKAFELNPDKRDCPRAIQLDQSLVSRPIPPVQPSAVADCSTTSGPSVPEK